MKRIAKLATIVIVVGCGGKSQSDGETRHIGPSPTSSLGNVAHAATPDASTAFTPLPIPVPAMPKNPSHISLRTPKAQILVTMASGAAYPYPVNVHDGGEDDQMITLYLPQGEQTNVALTAVDAEGRPLSEPVQVTIEPEAKLGTNEFDGTPVIINFSTRAQNTLHIGENVVRGPTTEEFIGGRMRLVMQGVFTCDTDRVCEVEWDGCTEVYSFVDGPPVLHTESFSVSLKAGQRMGLYPVVEDGRTDSVSFSLRDPSCP